MLTFCDYGLLDVLVRVAITVMKHRDQKKLGDERVCFDHTSISQSINDGSQAG